MKEFTCDKVHINWYYAFIVARGVIGSFWDWQSYSMAAIMEEEDIAWPGIGDKVVEGMLDVGTSGLCECDISVNEDGDVPFGEAKPIHERLANAHHIIDAAPELIAGVRIVASHQNSFLGHG